MRKIYEQQNGNEMTRIYWNAQWEEYVVKFYSKGPDGKYHLLKDADYHDSDKISAIATANNWVN